MDNMVIQLKEVLQGILVMVWHINGNLYIMIHQVMIGLVCNHGVKNEMPNIVIYQVMEEHVVL